MAYADFKRAYEAETRNDPERAARLWNIENETRINAVRGQFRRTIGRHFRAQLASGKPDGEAATAALDDAIEETKPVASRWLGHLPVPVDAGVPSSVQTHVHSNDFARYGTGVTVDPDEPPGTISRYRLKSKTDRLTGTREPVARFLWVTFEVEGSKVSGDDPTTVTRELGLAHFRAKVGYVYRFALAVTPDQQCYIPTALDAKLGASWRPPPTDSSDPWGLTRDLVDGESRWPELLVETANYLDTPPDGTLVSPPGEPARRIDEMHVDYMIGR